MLLLSGILLAQTPQANPGFVLERLVMPGPVIEGHAEYENDCGSCHAPFDKTSQRALCLACHEGIAADIDRHEGYHGRIQDITSTECRRCHTDHEGREADIVPLDEGTFDHELTDFILLGAHVDLPCSSCHVTGSRHRNAETDCIACHRNEEPHRGRLGETCSDCHGETAWDHAHYDHGETDFALTGAHAATPCNLCHPDERYARTPRDCFSCHGRDDAHAGRHGHECGDCHGTEAWDAARFDHDRDTEFPLTGKHATAVCTACHAGNVYDAPPPRTCHGCHTRDDVHKGRHGTDCAACHDTREWAAADFDHDRDTDFALRGAHVKITCAACHRGNVYDEAPPHDCGECHQLDDVHRGRLGADCAACHGETSWRQGHFDHGLTGFPLVGMHVLAACERCHVAATYEAESAECITCHRSEDEHDRKLGPDCGMCHNPNGWNRWLFDHAARTDYPLEGRHANLDCLGCHTEPVAAARQLSDLSSACYTCHAHDDVHRGGFGRLCGRCHVTDGFDRVEGH